jgi:hypothetical protein
MKRPKIPEPTAQELAVVERQSRQLDEEMAGSSGARSGNSMISSLTKLR